jgi:TonB-linked SusC/RagA family outer membrane protein
MRIMRISLLLLFVLLLPLYANTEAQNQKVNLKAKGEKLKDVLLDIESQTDLTFIYNHDVVNELEELSIEVKDAKVSYVLDNILADQSLDYKIIDDKVMLFKANKSVSSETMIQDNVVVKGLVTDVNGDPLPGVNVYEKTNPQNGVITGVDGKYTISVDANTTLTFSYIGFEEQSISVLSRNNIDIVLISNMEDLDEVVVVGYQSKERKNLTGAVTTVTSEQLENRPTARAADLLQGVAPGLIINRGNPGRLGGGSVSIQVQGTVARQNTDVLVVIDGIPQPPGAVDAINSVNPNDIESINILKDGEAVVYGARASAGVIVITTKTGKKDQIKASYTKTFTKPSIYPKKANVIDMYLMMDKAWEMNGDAPFFGFSNVINYIKDNNLTYDDIKNNNYEHVIEGSVPWPDTPFLVFSHHDWYKEMFGTAVSDNYDISVSGSSDKMSYYMSVGLIDEGSMLRHGTNSNLTGFGRFKMDYTFNDYITVGANINIRYQNLEAPWHIENLEGITYARHTYDVPYTPEGRYHVWGGFQNPIATAKERGNDIIRKYNLQPQFYANIRPIKQVTIRAVAQKSFEGLNNRYTSKWYNSYRWDESFAFPSFSNRDDDTQAYSINHFNQSFNGTLSAEYKETFKDDHALRLFAAYTHEEFQVDKTFAGARGLAYTGLNTVNLGDAERNIAKDEQNEEVLRGIVGNVAYTYKNRYTIEGYYRRDGSSRFADGYKWSDFYGAGASWVVSDEPFFTGLGIGNIVSNLKLRANYGELGNKGSDDEGIGKYDFVQPVDIYNASLLFGAPGSVSKAQVARLGGFASNTRTWQVAQKFNFGIDASFLRNRLTSAVNIYKTKTNDAFFLQDFPQTLGATPPSINGADFEVSGWDLELKWNDRLENGLNYYVSFGINNANSKAIELADDVIPGLGYNSWVEGYPLGAVFGYEFDGIMQNQEEVDAYYSNITGGIPNVLKPGDARYKDLDGDGVLEGRLYKEDENGNPTEDSGDMRYMGEGGQHYQYFFNLGASFKGFEISAVLNGVGKWKVMQRDRAGFGGPWVQPLEHLASDPGWTPENPGATFPRYNVMNGSFSNQINDHNYAPSNAPYLWIDAPWLGIKNLQVAYNLPKHWVSRLRLDNVKIFANGTDLGYLINKMPDSYSPEEPFKGSISPYIRSYSIGLNVGF